jgi:hypothetical protein
MHLRVRSDAQGPLILEVKTAEDAGYFATVQAGPAWRDVTLRWADFAREGKAGAALPDPAQVTKLVWADTADVVPASGTRRVWVADWTVR